MSGRLVHLAEGQVDEPVGLGQGLVLHVTHDTDDDSAGRLRLRIVQAQVLAERCLPRPGLVGEPLADDRYGVAVEIVHGGEVPPLQ